MKLRSNALTFVALLARSTTAFTYSHSSVQPFSSRRSTLKTPLRRTPIPPSPTHFHGPLSPTGPLKASPLSSGFASSLGSLAILATIVLIHECGHYLSARGFGIKVEEFSIGVGPKILGFKAFGDEFNLRALPLGGYVRFPENYDTEKVIEKEREAMKAIDEFTRKELQSPVDKLLNVLTLGAIGEGKIKEENDRRLAVSEELEGTPWWKKVGSKGQPKEDLSPLVAPDDLEIDYYDDPQLLQNRPWQERVVVLSGGVIFNFILSFLIFFGVISMGAGLPSPVFSPGTVVSSIVSNDSAAKGILRKGDVILDVNGKALTLSERPNVAESQKAINNFVSTIRNTPDGNSLKLTVLHPNDKNPVQVDIKPKKSSTGSQSIGVLLSPNYSKTEILKTKSIPEAVGLAASYTSSMIRETATGLTMAFSDLFTGRAGSSGASISGPIGLINQGTQIVSSKDWTTAFLFMAALSVNLGVVNAFPIPALDGGQLLFVLFEAATKRKVNQRVQEGITGATLLFLLFISAGAAFGDLENIFLGNR